MDTLVGLTQQELATLVSLILIPLGIILSGLSVLTIEGIDKDRAERMGNFFFTSGVSLGFGVTMDSAIKKRQRKREEGQEDDWLEGEEWMAEEEGYELFHPREEERGEGD